jgi:CheY-like chemotaxis protein
MIRAIVVSAADLSRELSGTLLYRSNVERLAATGYADVRQLAQEGRPDVVVVDSALPGAATLVASLRQDPCTRRVAIVALARSEFSFGHLDLLDAGANAILPLPPGADWDDRLMRLVHVPVRKATRLAVAIAVEGGMRGGLRFSGRALNLSVNGVLLECAQALEVGDDLRLLFQLPSEFGAVSATGTVVRLRPPRHYGIEITYVEGDGRVRIKRYVESGLPD